MKLLKVLHEKSDGRGAPMSLCLYEASDGTHVYGVEIDGKLAFTGTKAEAKARYGRGW